MQPFEAQESFASLWGDNLVENMVKMKEKMTTLDFTHFLLKYLCMVGDYEQTIEILTCSEDMKYILDKVDEDGTLFHTALYWNTNHMGHKFFNLFNTCNAKICKNSRGEFPWEQKGDSWNVVYEGERINLGERDVKDFEILYRYIPLKIKKMDNEFKGFISSLFKDSQEEYMKKLEN